MADLSQVSTEDLMRMRGAPPPASSGVNLSNVSTEDLMRMRAGNVSASPPQRSVAGELARQAGLTLRAGAMGFTYPVRMLLDAAGIPSTQAESNLLTRLGVPVPQGSTERVAQDVAQSMAGGATGAGIARLASSGASAAAPTVGRLIAEKLAEGPGMQVVSAGTGAGAGGITREMGGGPTAQTVATLVGGMAPSLAQAAGAATIRGLTRGGEAGRQTVAQNVQQFANAGTTPTVGQATEERAPRLAETMLSKTPGSAGTMAEKAAEQHAQMGAKVGELADELSPRTGAAPAGRAIKAGITGPGGFIDQFKQKSADLYGALDAQMPPETPVSVQNTSAALDRLTAPIKGAEATSGSLVNPRIAQIADNIKTDAGTTGQVPYQAVKELRTRVGSMLASNDLISDVPRAQLKQLYAGLSQDMTDAAAQQGPEALKAAERAAAYTRAGHARIENVLEPILNKVDPEDVYRAATSGMKEGATTIWGTVRSLPKDGQNAVAATVLKRLGVATPGNQNELGEIFSPDTFLTNWNKISPEAKTALFSRYGPDFTKNLDQIASTASNLRAGSKVFANPSGTEGAFTSRMGIAGVLLSVLWGHPGVAASLGGGMATAGAGAKLLMTNPDFVRWLAKSTTVAPGGIQGSITALENTARNQPADVKQAMLDYSAAARAKAAGSAR